MGFGAPYATYCRGRIGAITGTVVRGRGYTGMRWSATRVRAGCSHVSGAARLLFLCLYVTYIVSISVLILRLVGGDQLLLTPLVPA